MRTWGIEQRAGERMVAKNAALRRGRRAMPRLRSAWVLGILLVAALMPGFPARAEDTATLTGKVHLHADAKPPRVNLLKQMNDVKCSEQHDPKKGVGSEGIVAREADPPQAKTFVLQHVIVHVSSNLNEKQFPVPEAAKTLDQKGCMFLPHVLTLQAGQPLIILNSDPLLHNSHVEPAKNSPFNVALTNAGKQETRVFKKAEIIKVKCDVHPWMSAWVGVFDHPYHAVTNGGGEYEIKNLPPGEYEMTAWQEELGTVKQKVSVKPGGNTLDFHFELPAKEAGK